MNKLANALFSQVSGWTQGLKPLITLVDAFLSRLLTKDTAAGYCVWQCYRCFYSYTRRRYVKWCRRCCRFGRIWLCGRYRLYYC